VLWPERAALHRSSRVGGESGCGSVACSGSRGRGALLCFRARVYIDGGTGEGFCSDGLLVSGAADSWAGFFMEPSLRRSIERVATRFLLHRT
jgi:hypothetical protein